MTFQSLYRKYRPDTMTDIVGQDTIVEILSNAILKDRIGHAYLFTGPRGTGKTSTAKVFARAVNCTDPDHVMCGTCENCTATSHPDIVEIDAASNNGVEEIRSLIERVKYSPILGRYKVYIIDEVHMLTQSAFNALLKTLEEPPAHVIFILATTEIHKVIPTIISRCQRFDFMRISDDAIVGLLDRVVTQESMHAEPEALRAIAQLAHGGMRNALTILEQAMVLEDETITLSSIQKTHGLLDENQTIELFEAIATKDTVALNSIIKAILLQSVHLDHVVLYLTYHVKDSIIYSATQDVNLVPVESVKIVMALDQLWSLKARQNMMVSCVEMLDTMRTASDPRLYFEVGLLRLLQFDSAPAQKTSVAPVQEPNAPIASAVKTEAIEVSNVDEVHDNITEDEDTLVFETFDTVTPLEMESEACLIELMASGNKDVRMMDERAMASIDTYLSDATFARISSHLRQASVVISNDWFIVLTIQNPLQVQELLRPENHELMHRFVAAVLGQQKEVYVVDQSRFASAIAGFKSRMEQNNLPVPLERPATFSYEFSVEKKDTPLERIQSLFGDQVEVKL